MPHLESATHELPENKPPKLTPPAATPLAAPLAVPLTRPWLVLAIVVVFVCLTGGVGWVLTYPLPTGYDEASYLNTLRQDVDRLEYRSFFHAWMIASTRDGLRPPLYRIVAFPYDTIFGASAVSLRMLSGLTLLVTVVLVYRAGKRLVDAPTGCLAVAMLASVPQVLAPSFRFGMEFVLLLGVAMTLYFLARAWNAPRTRVIDVIGLAVGLAIGLYGKFSFVAIAGPLITTLFFVRIFRWPGAPSFGFLLRVVALTTLFVLPWYAMTFDTMLAYAQYSSRFTRAHLDSTWMYPWLLAVNGLGWPVSLLIAVLVARVAWLLKQNYAAPNPQSAPVMANKHVLLFAGVLVTAVVPTLFLHMTGSNQHPRFFAPLLIPIVLAAACIAGASGLLLRRSMYVFAVVIFAAQLTFSVFPLVHNTWAEEPRNAIVRPTPAYMPYDQWDWRPLRSYFQTIGLEQPALAYVGAGQSYNKPQILLAWHRHGEHKATATRLWAHDQLDENSQLVVYQTPWAIERAREFDAILVAPDGFNGVVADKQHLDNAHNGEFIQAIERDPRFRAGTSLTFVSHLGESVTIQVYLNQAKLDEQETPVPDEQPPAVD